MKKLHVTFLVFCFAFVLHAGAQKNDNKENCLATVGFFTNTVLIKNIRVYLYNGSDIVDSAKVNSNKDFGFVLDRNKRYTICINAPDFYQRLITINTDLPEHVNTIPLFIFEFEIELIPEIKGVDDYYMDFPIAIIEFDPKTETFGYRKKYTSMMQRESRKVQAQFRVRKSR